MDQKSSVMWILDMNLRMNNRWKAHMKLDTTGLHEMNIKAELEEKKTTDEEDQTSEATKQVNQNHLFVSRFSNLDDLGKSSSKNAIMHSSHHPLTCIINESVLDPKPFILCSIM
ncbi:hypothetical protein KFK09_005604 [Dendrobium nobile]|uniref:Uncharacterized protein n=1 Tax=Dendrobium nobile TaxID=94219 RepID=A0A8T3BW50_DENNO|nr:hypothetical protein KFK09_005604 [Dendrobium nobile]